MIEYRARTAELPIFLPAIPGMVLADVWMDSFFGNGYRPMVMDAANLKIDWILAFAWDREEILHQDEINEHPIISELFQWTADQMARRALWLREGNSRFSNWI